MHHPCQDGSPSALQLQSQSPLHIEWKPCRSQCEAHRTYSSTKLFRNIKPLSVLAAATAAAAVIGRRRRCEVSGTTFERNSADSGGAIEAQGNATLTLTDSSFASNAAASFGGALSVIGSAVVSSVGLSVSVWLLLQLQH